MTLFPYESLLGVGNTSWYLDPCRNIFLFVKSATTIAPKVKHVSSYKSMTYRTRVGFVHSDEQDHPIHHLAEGAVAGDPQHGNMTIWWLVIPSGRDVWAYTVLYFVYEGTLTIAMGFSICIISLVGFIYHLREWLALIDLSGWRRGWC